MDQLVGVDWAPLAIPQHRRLETLAVLHYTFVFMIMPIICTWVPIYLLFTRVWWVMALYAVWFVYDLDTPKRGSRPWRWYRSSALWRYLADYFPITLVKTADLPPHKNYIIGFVLHQTATFFAEIYLTYS
jgi:2-acylglycerol O-acyltransferase 2